MSDQINEGAPAPEQVPAEQPSAAEPQAAVSEPQAAAEPGAPTGPTPGEAWDSVVSALGTLGDALSTWAKAAADTPENRKHVDEVRNGVNEMARQAGEAFSAMADSDFGRQFAEGATQMGQSIGEGAQEFSQAAAPHVATAFAGLADVFGRAAQKVSEATTARPAAEPPSRPAPEPPVAEEAAAPAPAASSEQPVAPSAPPAAGEEDAQQ